jgi:hypothetical protein
MAQTQIIPASSHSPGLAEVLERVLDKGVVIAGDIKIKLCDIELLTIQIRLLIASVDKARELGLTWWWQPGVAQAPAPHALGATGAPQALAAPAAPPAMGVTGVSPMLRTGRTPVSVTGKTPVPPCPRSPLESDRSESDPWRQYLRFRDFERTKK